VLLARFGSARAAVGAGWEGWREKEPELAGRLEAPARGRPGTERCLAVGEQLLSAAARLGAYLVTLGEEGYPALLPHTSAPPPVLWVRGELRYEDWRSVAIVGTRRASAYGRCQGERLAGEAAREGLTVVSGLARGVDAAAHRGALAAGGRTVAVFGCGLDRVYPPEHAGLAAEIAQQGALVSEFPPGVAPNPEHFPRRNRIIAGLCLGTVVVEAGERSGAMNTAVQALEAGRDVFAVPGDVGRPGSTGPHHLLREGAKLAECGADLVEEFKYLEPERVRPATQLRLCPLPGDAAEKRQAEALWRALQAGPGRAEDLAVRAGLPVGAATAWLVAWELEGKVRAFPDGRVGAPRG
jgi:DNA processing protein